jgi:hypothetical protein
MREKINDSDLKENDRKIFRNRIDFILFCFPQSIGENCETINWQAKSREIDTYGLVTRLLRQGKED